MPRKRKKKKLFVGGYSVYPDAVQMTKEAILLGDGPSKHILFEEPEFADDKDLIMVNKIGRQWWKEARWWSTLHPECMDDWWLDRVHAQYPMEGLKIVFYGASGQKATPKIPPVEKPSQLIHSGGTSSLLALELLWSLDYEHVHIFGVDMDLATYWPGRHAWEKFKGNPMTFYGEKWFDKEQWRIRKHR